MRGIRSSAVVAAMVAMAGAVVTATPASAAVTSLSCPGRTTHPHTFSNTTGEDYNNLYESFVGRSPSSSVSAGSSWTCTNFQRRDDVAELIFTSSLLATGGLGGSQRTGFGCGQLFVTDVATGSRFDVREERARIDNGDQVTCDWGEPTAFLTTGRTYKFEVSQSLTYDWEAPSRDTSYPFRAVITVHAEVPNGTSNMRNHPVCYRAVPGVACNSIPL